MIAFFFTMPISRITPISAMIVNSVPNSDQREQRADARRGQRREDRERVHQALVEHAEHDVDGEERGEDQPAAGSAATLERARRALERAVDRRRHADARHASPAPRRSPRESDTPSAQVERDRSRRRTGPGGSPRAARWSSRSARSPRAAPARFVGREHVDVLQRLRALPVLRRRLHHDAVLVALGVDGRDDRWPNAMLSVGSIMRGVMPRRAAVSRSMTSDRLQAARPPGRSLRRRAPARCAAPLQPRRPQCAARRGRRACSVNW